MIVGVLLAVADGPGVGVLLAVGDGPGVEVLVGVGDGPGVEVPRIMIGVPLGSSSSPSSPASAIRVPITAV